MLVRGVSCSFPLLRQVLGALVVDLEDDPRVQEERREEVLEHVPAQVVRLAAVLTAVRDCEIRQDRMRAEQVAQLHALQEAAGGAELERL